MTVILRNDLFTMRLEGLTEGDELRKANERVL
jgi:hypothetical protein